MKNLEFKIDIPDTVVFFFEKQSLNFAFLIFNF